MSLRLSAAGLVFITVTVTAQTPAIERRRADLEAVRTQLPRLHLNLFGVTTREEFEAAAGVLASEVGSLSNEAFYVRLVSLVAMARDAHTTISLDGAAALSLGFQPLPVLLRYFDDGVFVTAAEAGFLELNAARVAKVNEIPVEDVLERLRAVVSYENEWWFRSRVPSFLGNLGVLRGLGIVPADEPAQVTFRLAGGETRTVRLGARSGDLIRPVFETPGFTTVTLRRLDEFYWAEYWADTRTLYLAYRVCRESARKPIEAFVREIVGLTSQGPVETVVIDLRGNGGGDSRYFHQLLLGLREPLLGLLLDPRFRVYGLIDRGSFSSGMLAAEALKEPQDLPPGFGPQDGSPLITLIGEPTGGKPTSYGDVLGWVLPGSGLSGQYSTRFFMAPAFLPAGDAVPPDMYVGLRSSDYYARHDPQLAAVFARARPAVEGPSGDVIVVNGASLRADTAIAPGSVVKAMGDFTADLDSLIVNGEAVEQSERTAQQLTFRLPEALALGPATIEARSGSGVARGRFTVSATGPGAFSTEAGNPMQPGAIVNEDSTPNGPLAGAARGSVIRMLGTGFGSGPLAGWIAQQVAEVGERGAVPAVPGVWTLSLRVPVNGIPTGMVPVVIAADGRVSNAVSVWIQP